MTLLMREREKYKEGKAETALELGSDNGKILSLLHKKLNVDMEQAEEYLKSYYEGTL